MTRLEKAVVDVGHGLQMHLTECGAQNVATAKSLDDLKKSHEEVIERLDTMNKNAWKIVGTMLLVIFTAVVGVVVERSLHQPEVVSQQQFQELHNELQVIAAHTHQPTQQ